MKNEKIKVKLPKGWGEVTLGMLERLEGNGNPVKVLSVLSGLSEKEVEELPVQFVDALSKNIMFLSEMPKVEPKPSIRVNGEVYRINIQERMSFGEYVAVQMLLKADRHDYSGFLGILCRKEGEVYDTSFENEVLPERKRMFQGVSVEKAMPVVAFFLELWLVLRNSEQALMTLSAETLSQLDAIVRDGRRSRKDGDGSVSLTSWQRAKLKHLKRCIRRMLSR